MAAHINTTTALDEPRRALEARIEEMITLLDMIDGDPDLEDGHDAEPDSDGEPTLGWGAHGRQTQLAAFGPAAGEDGELEEDDPGEPSLASPERHPNTYGFGYGFGVTLSGNQLHWADGAHSGGKDDCEEENEHGGDISDEPQEDDSDREPSLASPENPEGDQTEWAKGESWDSREGGEVEEAPAVLAAAEKRSYAERDRTKAGGREAERQLAELRGDKAPFASVSNVRVLIVGPDARRYGVTRL